MIESGDNERHAASHSGSPSILQLTHAVICAPNVDEGMRAFGKLCAYDLPTATALARIMTAALPPTAALWQDALDFEHIGGGAGTSSPLADSDADDTAASVAGHMGWRDMRPRPEQE